MKNLFSVLILVAILPFGSAFADHADSEKSILELVATMSSVWNAGCIRANIPRQNC